MKPVAPSLPADKADLPSLQSEIRALCEAKASEERITVPSPPTEEALRAATPLPPSDEHDMAVADTIPSPPPPVVTQSGEVGLGGEDPLQTAIPRPPRVPNIGR
jgi:hypothetical protein